MPILDLSLDPGHDLVSERLITIPTDGQGEHVDFPSRRIGTVDRPVQSRQLTAKLSIAVLTSVLHHGACVSSGGDEDQTVISLRRLTKNARPQRENSRFVAAACS